MQQGTKKNSKASLSHSLLESWMREGADCWRASWSGASLDRSLVCFGVPSDDDGDATNDNPSLISLFASSLKSSKMCSADLRLNT